MNDNKNDIIIETHDLKKHYKGHSIRALDGVSMQVRRGEVVVIVGPSGSGKSTFLRSLNLLEMPTGGSIIFNGVDITDKHVNINRHRQKMGMVFQHFNLFPHMTVLGNLTCAPRKLLKLLLTFIRWRLKSKPSTRNSLNVPITRAMNTWL